MCPQSGTTLIEVLLVVAMLGLLVGPLAGWALVSMREDTATRARNVDSASIGLLRSYFVRDVASAKAVLAGTAANGSDCAGGEGAATAPTQTMLRLRASATTFIVYNLVASADGKSASVYRRECTAATIKDSSEIASRLGTSGLTVACSARPGAPTTDCGKVSLRATTVADEVISMTATMRTGTAAAAVAGGPVYMSPEVVLHADPAVVFRGESVALDASATVDPQGKALTFLWDFGDGSTPATTETASHVYSQLGQFTVVLTVTNSDGTPASDYVRIEVKNRLPTAVIASPAAPVSTNMCANVGFDGSGSSDGGDAGHGGGTVASYKWDYGDGASATLATAAHNYQYKQPSGTQPFTVGLKVVDNDGGTSPAVFQQVSVTNRTPTAAIAANGSTGTITATVGVAVNFTSTANDLDSVCDGGGLTYDWDFGDGTGSTLPNPRHTYSSKPAGKVKLTVTDRWGATATSNQITVTGNGPPVALFTASPNPARAGAEVTLTNGSTDPDGDALTYAWTFPGVGPGSPGTSTAAAPGPLKFTHNVGSADTFLSATYNLALTVTDAGGAARSVTVPVTVTGAPTPTGIDVSDTCTRTKKGKCTAYSNTVSWNPVSSVDGYQLEVRWKSCGSCSWTTKSYSVTTNSMLFPDDYQRTGDVQIRVRARDDYTDKYGQWTGWTDANFR